MFAFGKREFSHLQLLNTSIEEQTESTPLPERNTFNRCPERRWSSHTEEEVIVADFGYDRRGVRTTLWRRRTTRGVSGQEKGWRLLERRGLRVLGYRRGSMGWFAKVSGAGGSPVGTLNWRRLYPTGDIWATLPAYTRISAYKTVKPESCTVNM